MEVKKVVGESCYFCDLCGCEEKPYGQISAPQIRLGKDIFEEVCHLCTTCYHMLRVEIISKGGRFNQIC